MVVPVVAVVVVVDVAVRHAARVELREPGVAGDAEDGVLLLAAGLEHALAAVVVVEPPLAAAHVVPAAAPAVHLAARALLAPVAVGVAAADDVAVAGREAGDVVLAVRADLRAPLVLPVVRDARHPDVAVAPVLAAERAEGVADDVDALRRRVDGEALDLVVARRAELDDPLRAALLAALDDAVDGHAGLRVVDLVGGGRQGRAGQQRREAHGCGGREDARGRGGKNDSPGPRDFASAGEAALPGV